MKTTPYSPATGAKRLRKGFTLIEMLVVIAIIVILISLVSVSVGRSIRRAQSVKAVSNVRQLGVASLNYATDNQGALLGQGQEPHDWNDSLYMFRNLAIYLDSSLDRNLTRDRADRGPMRPQVDAALKGILDPAVPAPYNSYGGYPFTWAFNHIFNVRVGRRNEGLESWPSGLPRRPRRLLEFDHPASTLYVVSGRFQISVEQAADETFLTMGPRSRPFYLHGRKKDSTVGLYLDGSARLISFPIASEHIHPRTR